jgi:isocitrate/isopropylmalate dehydrogenase
MMLDHLGHRGDAARLRQAVEDDIVAFPGVRRPTDQIGQAIADRLRQA